MWFQSTAVVIYERDRATPAGATRKMLIVARGEYRLGGNDDNNKPKIKRRRGQ